MSLLIREFRKIPLNFIELFSFFKSNTSVIFTIVSIVGGAVVINYVTRLSVTAMYMKFYAFTYALFQMKIRSFIAILPTPDFRSSPGTSIFIHSKFW